MPYLTLTLTENLKLQLSRGLVVVIVEINII